MVLEYDGYTEVLWEMKDVNLNFWEIAQVEIGVKKIRRVSKFSEISLEIWIHCSCTYFRFKYE